MSHAINIWREKLEYLLQQEAILADPAQKFAIAKQIAEAKAKIAELEALAGGSPTSAQTAFRADISRIDKYAPAELIGREAETRMLAEAWAKAERGETKRPRVLTFVALGGEGKTSLVAKWVADLAGQDWPGCEAAFAWSFYSQGSREHMAASSDLFLKEALTFFGDSLMAGSPQGASEKGQRLAQLVGARRALLLLDGLEPLQYGPASPTAGELKDQGLTALLKGLAAGSAGLCVVTTRYSIPNLKAYWQSTAPEVDLKRLSTKAGVALLRSLGVQGTQAEYNTLVEDVRGHALTLNLFGTYLRDAHAGDIRKRDRVKLAEADAEEQGGHAFQVMDAYARTLQGEGEKGQRALALLSLLGLFDRPATADCLEALWKGPAIPGLTEPLLDLSDAQRNIALTRLEAAKLLSVNRDAGGTLLALDAHPLLREYFARRLRDGQPEAWRAGHQRLYEHLCATTHEGVAPTLEDLQPLYQAVAHGCLAGLQNEARSNVFRDRILRGTGGDGFYSIMKLGAFGSDLGAVASFFEAPWSRVSPALSQVVQSWLLGVTAFNLRALGRLSEALEPMRAGLEMDVIAGDWKNAPISANNLSELELALGEVAAALRDAEQSVAFADRSDDAFKRMGQRTTHADALHQAGRRAEAEARFREAEAMQAQRQPEYPLLYSVPGFRYCDLLLAGAERAAWRGMQNAELRSQNAEGEACRAVLERAAKTLDWWTNTFTNASILTIALEHLTLGRAGLYAAILKSAPVASAEPEIEQAVAGLRRAGSQDHLPRGFLTHAWLRALSGKRSGHESAQADLDEAWEIAERGPMPLHMADIHLHRARLFFREPRYRWVSPQHDLAEARRLIEKHGYWRRKEELEDAEAVILGSVTRPTSRAP